MISCTKNIIDNYSRLSYSEKIFADYVLVNRTKVLYMSVKELAETTCIAPSTIIAATKKLGYNGLRDFKISLASEPINPTDRMVIPSEHNQNKNIFHEVVRSNISALEETMRTLPCSLIDQATELLLHSRTIHIYGVGTSSILAREAYDFLFRLCLNCTLYTDPCYQQLSVSMQEDNDVSLIISQSGVNRESLLISEKIHSSGHKIIGISNYCGTPFAKYCDILLAALPGISNIHDNHFSFRIPILCILETLFYALSQAMGDRYHSAMNLNKSLINESSLSQSKS